MKKELKDKAIQLRSNGYSFKEISLILGVSKSTASLWARNVDLSFQAAKRLENIKIFGRRRALKINKIKNTLNWEKAAKLCPKLNVGNYNDNDCKIFLALLYWCEGEKTGKRFCFSNSDPVMVKVYLALLRRAYKIDNKKIRIWIHLHSYHDVFYILEFWSKLTGIPKNQFFIYNKPHTGISKKPGYKGCLSIRHQDSNIQKEIFIIIKRLKIFSNIAGLV